VWSTILEAIGYYKDALAIVINLIVMIEFEANPLVDGSETFHLFYVELHLLNKNMQ